MQKLAWTMLLFLTMIVVSCDSGKDETNGATTAKPDLETAFQLEAYRGQVLVVDFWATWCRPCINEIPEYNRIQRQFKKDSVKIIGLTMASGTAEEVQPYIDKYNIEYTVAMGTTALAAQFGGIQAFPTTFVLDKDLKVIKKYVGGGPAKIAEIEKLISQQLN